MLAASLEGHRDDRDGKLPPEIRQMLLVLQNVHQTPPSEAYFVLQQLVGKVVKSYLPMVARTRTLVKVQSESAPDSERQVDIISNYLYPHTSLSLRPPPLPHPPPPPPPRCNIHQSWSLRHNGYLGGC